MTDRLATGQQLNTNDRLVSQNGAVNLLMQGDGNLVLYKMAGNRAYWASNTDRKPVVRALFQDDGNFVCYDAQNKAYWVSGTDGLGGTQLILQGDGNLVIYNPALVPVWATNIFPDLDSWDDATGDDHLDTGEWMNSTASTNGTGLIFGNTRIWCTILLRGFHGSVLPTVYDASDKCIWPDDDPMSQKHQWGVDGVWIGASDRTEYWTNQLPANIRTQGRRLRLINFRDPKNMLQVDLPIIGQDVATVAKIVAEAAAAFG